MRDFETRLDAKTYNIEHLDARLRKVHRRAMGEQNGGKKLRLLKIEKNRNQMWEEFTDENCKVKDTNNWFVPRLPINPSENFTFILDSFFTKLLYADDVLHFS